MTKKLCGSYRVDGRRSLTLSIAGGDKPVDVGFRLVCDDAGRVRRGGSWLYTADSARAAYRGRNGPVRRYDGLGLRLVREEA